MKQAIASLASVSPYGQNKAIGSPKKDRELDDAFERRVWRERMHVTDEGCVYIPPMAFCNSIKEAAQFLSLKIPGQRNATYTKHFDAGILVPDPLVLPDRAEEVPGEWLHLPSDGKRGGGSRVWKCLPRIEQWAGDVCYLVLDDIISPDVFERVLKVSGSLIGIGRFRPIKRGFYGRFKVEKIAWKELQL